MKIIEKETALLKEYPHNNRRHSEEHVKKIAESIKRFGWRKPIEIDTNNFIIAGHGRLKAAKLLKFDTVPVVVNHDIETNNRAYRIFDNKITEAPEWDFENLEHEIDFLKEEDFELESLGLDDFEIPEVEKDIEEVEADNPDDIENVFIKVGDLIELDQHRVLCGDATLEESYTRLMDGQKADMVLTDPPYGVDYKGINNDSRSGLEGLLDATLKNLRKVCENGVSVYIFHSDRCADIFQKIYRKYCHFSSIIIWKKNSLVLSQTDYQSIHEPILYGWFDNGTHNFFGDRKQLSVIEVEKEPRPEKHTTPKPIKLIEALLKNSSKKNNLVLDSFLGSGSTLIASEQLGRTCYGMELEPKYCQVIINRYLKLKPDAEIRINGELWEQEDQNLSQRTSKEKMLSGMQALV